MMWPLWFSSNNLINMRPRASLKIKFDQEFGVRKKP